MWFIMLPFEAISGMKCICDLWGVNGSISLSGQW